MRRHLQTAAIVLALGLIGCSTTPAPAAPGDTIPVDVVRMNPTPEPEAPRTAMPAEPERDRPEATATPQPEPSVAAATVAAPVRTLKDYLGALSAVSCPAGVAATRPDMVDLTVRKVGLSPLNPGQTHIGQLDFVAGFHLVSSDTRFGGLSGLDLLPDGNLLAISDQGDFVWIDLAADGVTPVAARLSSMHDASGQTFGDKTESDAEGLAVNGGMALVSFERDHRILAFDLGKCGAAARGAPIVFGDHGIALPKAFAAAGLAPSENSGVEPLAVTDDWYLLAGLETLDAGSGPLSVRPIEAGPRYDLRVEKGAPDFVGLDVLPAEPGRLDLRAFTLHRGFSPATGVSITISESTLLREIDQSGLPARRLTELEERARERFSVASTRRLAQLGILQTIDNFEGLAARQMPDGHVRLYIISDNNFSDRQRTLLMVFDLKP